MTRSNSTSPDARSTGAHQESVVLFKNSEGVEGRGTLVRLTRSALIFETYNPYSIVQLSEVLSNVKVCGRQGAIYNGRAMVSNLVSTGMVLIVSVSLVDPWSDIDWLKRDENLAENCQRFVEDWIAEHQIRPSYQLVVSTMRNFLSELGLWLQEAELTFAAHDKKGLVANTAEHEMLEQVRVGIEPQLSDLIGRFELEAGHVPPDQLTVHRAFARRELHPLTLCAPFAWRTFAKPLGYAGDYQMVNMILGESELGANLYAKLLNVHNVSTPPAEAHRNRITWLGHVLQREARRRVQQQQRLRVLNVGCGPAVEVQRFLQSDPLAEQCDFTLMDFNDETLDYVQGKLTPLTAGRDTQAKVQFRHQSIHSLLKQAALPHGGPSADGRFDLIYCAGLFDYLSDRVCRRLLQLFCRWTEDDGLVIATNVHPRNPVRNYMEHLSEWYLIYRNEGELAALVPDDHRHELTTDPTGVNVFVEIRKPRTTDT